ncbi:MAG: hydroxyacylglutathione hydrolase [bacterium]
MDITNHHNGLKVIQFPCLSDNYGFLLHDPASGLTATIDTPDALAINECLDRHKLTLTHIFNTHWHWDHTGGNDALKQKWQCMVVGPAKEGGRIPAIDQAVQQGDPLQFGDYKVSLIETPGHTKGHMIWHFDTNQIAFVGDALFSLGCGRVMEGTAEQMWTSLKKIRSLPSETIIYCAHEYSLANGQFALTIEPDNSRLQERCAEIAELRRQGKPTVPVRLVDEKLVNPFLRADRPELAQQIGLEKAAASDVFAEIRKRKDVF